MHSVRLLFGLVLFAGTIAAGRAQPVPPAAPPLAVLLLDGIDDPVVVSELKLTEDQLQALVGRRQQVWDDGYNLNRVTFAQGAKARNAVTDAALQKVLSADQYKRAAQLAAQSLLTDRRFDPRFGGDVEPALNLARVPSSALVRYPQLAEALKLTDEQKQQLAVGGRSGFDPELGGGFGGFPGGRLVVLSEQQQAAAKALVGPVAKTWAAKSDTRLNFDFGAPGDFDLLAAKDVRAELKLAPADDKALGELAQKWRELPGERSGGLSPKELDARYKGLTAETLAALKTLTPAQRKRLEQLAFQFGDRPSGTWFVPSARAHIEERYGEPDVVAALGLTEEQVKALAAAYPAFEKEATAVLVAATDPATADKTLAALVSARRDRCAAVLAPGQAAQWNEMVGAPFTGNATPDRDARVPAAFSAMAASNFGKHTVTGLNMLAGNKSVQDELKLDEKQINKAVEVANEVRQKYRVPFGGDEAEREKAVAARSEAVAAGLTAILNPDQAKRFRQLMLQYYESRSTTGFGALQPTVGYPGVAEEIKLTDEQKKKILAGTAAADVLTADQKAQIPKMLGEPFKGDFSLRGGAPGGPVNVVVASDSVRLLAGRENLFRAALNLTADQGAKLDAARAAYQKAVQVGRGPGPAGGEFGGGRWGLTQEQLAARTAAQEAFDKAVAQLLTAAQKARMEQLVLQQTAATDLFVTLASVVRDELKLTNEQTAQLATLNREANDLQRMRSYYLRADPDKSLGGDVAAKMRDAADERMFAVLTDAQRAKWGELTGEPLKGLVKTVPFGGFGGGFAPPGGGFGGGFGPPGGFIP